MRSVVLAIALAVLALTSREATADAIIDQQVLPGAPSDGALGAGFGPDFRFQIQTFTVGTSGLLDGLDLFVQARSSSGPLRVELQKYDGTNFYQPQNVVVDTSVAEADIPVFIDPISALNLDFHVDISSFGVEVSPGDTFAILLSSDFVPGRNDNEPFVWSGSTLDPYAGDQAFQVAFLDPNFPWQDSGGGTDDFAFRDYVATSLPEPSSLVLLGTFIVFWLMMRLRRRSPCPQLTSG